MSEFMSGGANIEMEGRKDPTCSQRPRVARAGGRRIHFAECGVTVPIDEGFTIPVNREGFMVGRNRRSVGIGGMA